MNSEFNNFTQPIQKHSRLEFPFLLLNLSPRYSTTKIPFPAPTPTDPPSPSQPLYHTFCLCCWQDRVSMTQEPATVTLARSNWCRNNPTWVTQRSTKHRPVGPPRLGDNESEALGWCRERHTVESGGKTIFYSQPYRADQSKWESLVKLTDLKQRHTVLHKRSVGPNYPPKKRIITPSLTYSPVHI